MCGLLYSTLSVDCSTCSYYPPPLSLCCACVNLVGEDRPSGRAAGRSRASAGALQQLPGRDTVLHRRRPHVAEHHHHHQRDALVRGGYVL